MSKAHECICCQEIPEDSQKLEEIDEWGQGNDRSSCITDTDALRAICLNKWVLQTAFYQYSAQYNDHYEGPQHKKQACCISPACQVVLGLSWSGGTGCPACFCCLLYPSTFFSTWKCRRFCSIRVCRVSKLK